MGLSSRRRPLLLRRCGARTVAWPLLVLCLVCVWSVERPRAQTLFPSGNRFKFQTLSVDDGLSQSVVRSIFQDRQGFLWFGTWDGLNRYDGHRFQVFRHQSHDPHTLSDSRVEAIHQTEDGLLWIGTHAGLDRFDPRSGRFVRYSLGAESTLGDDNTVSGIVGAEGGKLWVSTSYKGLYLFNPADGSLQEFSHDPANEDSPASDAIPKMLRGHSGELWLGTGCGLDRFDPRSGRFEHYRLQDDQDGPSRNSISALAMADEGTVWFGTPMGLNRLDPASGIIQAYRHDPEDDRSLTSDSIMSLLLENDGILWVGTWGGGVCELPPSSEEFVCYRSDDADPFSLSHDFVAALLVDESGVLWLGTHGGGLSKRVRDRSFFESVGRNPGREPSLGSPRVSAIAEASGALWVGTDQGLDRMDSSGVHSYRPDLKNAASLGSDLVGALVAEDSKTLWVGTVIGLYRMDIQQETFQAIPFEVPRYRVRTLYLDRSGTLWAGTSTHGLLRLDREAARLVRRPVPKTPEQYAVNVLMGDPSDPDVLWMGTENLGLHRFHPPSGTTRVYRHRDGDRQGLSHDTISALRFDADGRLWVGTYGGGLNRLDAATGTVALFDETNGLPNPIIYGILQDEAGRLWVGTNKGIVWFDPRHPTFVNLDVRDGLPTNEFNVNAHLEGSGGTLYFGSIAGLIAFYPDRMGRDDYAPPVVFTSLSLNQRPVPLPADGAPFALPYRSGLLSIEFASLDFRLPLKNKYAYRFRGQSVGWINLGDVRELSFPNLSPGSYELEVRGTNSNGVWSGRTASIALEVPAPWWAWWWVRLGGLLAAAGLVWGSVRIWRSHSRRYQLALQEEVERRQYLQAALLRHIASNESVGDARKGAAPWWLRQARDRLRKEFRAAPTVKELADAAGIHPDYLGRCFREHYGIRVGEYVDRLRLEWAGRRLVGTADKIIDIALEAGFSDQSHLTRRFKRHFGVTPAQYRRFSERGTSTLDGLANTTSEAAGG